MAVTEPPAVTGFEELLQIRGLSVGRGPRAPLRGVDAGIACGEVVAVVGEPGAGKTTLVRCIAGDMAPAAGSIRVGGSEVTADAAAAQRAGVAVVWQDLALCDNLDVAANLLLGQETPRLMLSESRFHAAAAAALEAVRLPIAKTTQLVSSLSAAQRQLLAIARAVSRDPRLLVLDEPTDALGAAETERVEELIRELQARGTAVLLVTQDARQALRLAARILVLHQGRLVAELSAADTHPDELAALQAGQPVNATARRQLTRLHGMAGRLVEGDPASSLSVILSALAGAFGTDRACIHVVRGDSLECAASLGLEAEEILDWATLPMGSAGGTIGRAAHSRDGVSEPGVWSVPVVAGDSVVAVITVLGNAAVEPERDDLHLLSLYAGYAASAIERDRLLEQVTSRNRVLETIREMLESLTGSLPVGDGLRSALASLRRGLQANEVALVCDFPAGPVWRAFADRAGSDADRASPAVRQAATLSLADTRLDGTAQPVPAPGGRILAVPFGSPSGPAVLLAHWVAPVSAQDRELLENAAHSLRLALEREEAAAAHQEAAALRRSQEMQREFLSRLSHELRTPLTAIRGYASSLMQTDVSWDEASESRFLNAIATESARLGRLVDDLLDFSAIESGVMRLQTDWCDIGLVVEAAIACLPASAAGAVTVTCQPELPPVWADHDRLEQVFVNLLGNALRHNPTGTRVSVTAALGTPLTVEDGDRPRDGKVVEITIADDGTGLPADLAAAPFDGPRQQRTRGSGAGLGLSIAHGIVEAHKGRIEALTVAEGTAFRITLFVEPASSEEALPSPETLEPVGPAAHAAS